MADVVFNIAKGRVVEYYNRVKSNDPANSALILIPVKTSGLETDATLIDKDDIAAVFLGTTDEAVDGTWSRKVLTDADLAAFPTPDDTNDRYEVSTPLVTWTSLTGAQVSKLIVAYDADTTSGTDSSIIPLTMHDFAVIPDGTNLQIPISTFFRAS